MTEQATLKDFFISYNKADRAWAEWIAWRLQEEGYTVVLQAWDFRPGSNFLLQMNEVVSSSKRTIALLSPDYLDPKAVFSHVEWAAVFVQDPEGQKSKLLPIRVRECTPTGLLAAIIYIDLVGRTEVEARNELIAGIRRSRNLPFVEPLFPGSVPTKPLQTPVFPGDWPTVWNVPHDRNWFFTGRDDLLLRLHDMLTSTKAIASIQVKGISGLGGIGKTQTALEYAYRYGHEYRYVLWVNAVTIETLASDIVHLATILQIPEDSTHDPQKTIDAVKRWLSHQRDWLLIVDNIDDLTMISKFLPRGARTNGHVLLTTRASTGGALAQMIEVEKMNKDEGVLLFLRRITALSPDEPLEQANSHYRSDAEAIVRLLDGLPLAIDQAGAYIEEMGTTSSAYLRLYQTRHADLLRRRGQFPPGHPETVATTWSLSFQQVEQANPIAADLLRLLSFLAPDAIPESLISEGVSTSTDEVIAAFADSFVMDEAIEVLRKFSLVRRNPEMKIISIHRLVQVTLKDIMDDDVKKQWARRVVFIVNAALPKVAFQRFDLYQEYFPHAQVATDLIGINQLSSLEATQLLYKIGWYLRGQGKYEQAGSLYEQALTICKKELGLYHVETAAALEGKGTIYYYLGKYEQAEELLQQALDIHEHIPGAGLEKAVVLNNFANFYQVQGKYKRAEDLLQQALDIHEHITGAELENAVVLNNLANLYQNQWMYEKAEPLYQRVLSIQEKALGSEHPYIAGTLLGLANNLYQAQGKYEQAEPLYQRALNIQEKAFGSQHPDTGGILQGLANLYQAQGKYEQAEPLYQRALSIQEKNFGSEHLNTATTLQGLANFYQAQGKYEQAEQFFQRALSIEENALGPEHPATGGTLQGLADLHQAQGKYQEAEPLYQRVLNIQEKAFDSEHPYIAGTSLGLANLYQAQGKYEQAEPLYQRALNIQEKAFGSEHFNVTGIVQGLANLYQAQGKYQEAEPLYQRVLNIQEKAFGSEHPYIAGTLQGLANLYQAQGKYEQAELFYQRILSIQEKAFGSEHLYIAGSFQGLANLYKVQEKYEEAELLYQRALDITVKDRGSEHIDTASIVYFLANLYQAQREYEQAALHYQRTLSVMKPLWGQDFAHRENILYLESLANLYLAEGKHKEAALYYQRTLNTNKPGRLKMHVGSALVPIFDPEQGGVMLALIKEIRDQLVKEQGFILPSVNIQDSLNIDAIEYELLINDKLVFRKKIHSDFALLKSGDNSSEMIGIETVEPGYDTPIHWITNNAGNDLEKIHDKLLSPAEIICSNLKRAFIENQSVILE